VAREPDQHHLEAQEKEVVWSWEEVCYWAEDVGIDRIVVEEN